MSSSTLQRSSVSFRRQGSSGRVWDNLQIDRKTSGPPSGYLGTPPGPSQDLLLKEEACHERSIREISSSSSSSSSSALARISPSKHENKDQRCNVLGIFRRCVGSSAT
ncbi:hypothetical protein JCGZ_09688 [Jatropha curcas]|uniref:Uncharacterized protein n=1 Tax=Jatropha curcas TaxID=180498 RepID=A0A067LM06_JATCU|nr:hypothetical protein JCGZ_09688 [Jatropha curcas]